jgi:hypothetical protein
MPTLEESADLYEQLVMLSQEALAAGHYEAAYHALTAAMHVADDTSDAERLREVARLARVQRDHIDRAAPGHRMASGSAPERHGFNFYDALAQQAAAHATMAEQRRRTAERAQAGRGPAASAQRRGMPPPIADTERRADPNGSPGR